jgi:hypothetical protein
MEKRPLNTWLSRDSMLVFCCSLIGTQNHYPLSDHCAASQALLLDIVVYLGWCRTINTFDPSHETLLVSGSHDFAHISATLPQSAFKKSYPLQRHSESSTHDQHMISKRYWGWRWVSDPNLWQRIRDGIKEVPNVQSREAVCCRQKCSVPQSWDTSQQPRVQICRGIQ